MKTKKQMVSDYRRLKFPMGVIQIRNTVNSKVFLDSGLNLPALENRHRFQLNLGSHPNADLQSDWKTHGEAAFLFEVVSELRPKEEEGVDYRAELKALEELCFEEIRPYGPRGYHGADPNKKLS